MKFVTINGEFTNEQEVVEDCKRWIAKLGPINGRFPVIKKQQFGRKMAYGIQYWTREQITLGEVVSGDEKSILVYSKY